MQKKLTNFIISGFMLGLVGCSKEEFGRVNQKETNSISEREQFSNSSCALSSLVKPKVDMLFLFDNSTSSFFINAQGQQAILEALRGTVLVAAERFDFRIMVAPLKPSNSNRSSSSYHTEGVTVAVANEDGITSSGKRLVVNASDNLLIEKTAAIQAVRGSSEYGFERAHDLIKYHHDNTQVFRSGAHTLIALFSNEDADWRQDGPDLQGVGPEKKDYNSNKNDLISLSNRILALQFRFVTIAPSRDYDARACSLPHAKRGIRYRRMSNDIYLHNRNDKQGFQNISATSPYDNYDLCSQDYQGIFTGINKTITDIVVPHTYNFWPITNQGPAPGGGPPFDSDSQSIEIYKVFSNSSQQSISRSSRNGWTLVNGYRSGHNIRREPTVGEPFNGYFIELHGNAEVTYPECLRIETSAPYDYFGYIVATIQPDLTSVEYKKNRRIFSQSSSNGWTYLGFKRNFNIRIDGQSYGHQPGLPAVNKTGHIFQLNGDAAYSNGDKVELKFDPAPLTP